MARNQTRDEPIQTLWGGYGKLVRRHAPEGPRIVKDIRWPDGKGDRSHQRKLRSYQVEAHWYEHWSLRIPARCRIPRFLGSESRRDGLTLVLEDLDRAGYARRSSRLEREDLEGAIGFLAAFHAAFLGVEPQGLWKEGSYWQLGTRSDEWKAMPAGPLRQAAPDLDRRLARARFRTIVHGDAKPDNFCLGGPGKVAMVDFQYAGGGCGMRDLAYLIDDFRESPLDPSTTSRALDTYFRAFRRQCEESSRPTPSIDEVESEWRILFPVAWLDFQRFLQGWSPGYGRGSRSWDRAVRQELEKLEE
ncbi:MAG: aminoglycoside phosphotransferase family protein [Fibrobacteria bacterium]|nr:aminoglycoside phosphotransferase family protein [Fibrobacteria bacterium]